MGARVTSFGIAWLLVSGRSIGRGSEGRAAILECGGLGALLYHLNRMNFLQRRFGSFDRMMDALALRASTGFHIAEADRRLLVQALASENAVALFTDQCRSNLSVSGKQLDELTALTAGSVQRLVQSLQTLATRMAGEAAITCIGSVQELMRFLAAYIRTL